MMIILISDNLVKIITKWLKMCVQYPANNVQTASGSGNDEAGNVGAAWPLSVIEKIRCPCRKTEI
jgi:hypothetical protein